jgi:hypothetical protein
MAGDNQAGKGTETEGGTMTIQRVISGGQSGADLAGWRAAKAAGIPTGGWMVERFLTEDSHRPEFASEFGARLLPDVAHLSNVRRKLRLCAEANVRDADATICFDLTGSDATSNANYDCNKYDRQFRCVMLDQDKDGAIVCGNLKDLKAFEPRHIAQWVIDNGIRTLNVCGNRESKAPGIGAFVERYMTEVFRLLAEAGHLKMTEDTR